MQDLSTDDLVTDTANPLRVLVVDDDANFRAMPEEYLASHGIRVLALASGRQMLEAFESEAINLVLTDIRMPSEYGMMLVHALGQRSSVPIVLNAPVEAVY